jgi:hypothetical protein
MRSSKNNKTSRTAVTEALESRELLSATPLTINQTPVYNGTQLVVIGTAANDKITVTQTTNGLLITDNTWTTTVAGNFASLLIESGNGNDSVVVSPTVTLATTIVGGTGSDTFTAGSGTTEMFGGTGTNVLHGGSGADTFVTLNSTADSIYGGTGNDEFWTDNNANEKIFNLTSTEAAYGAVHRVGSFYGATQAPTPTAKGARSAKKSAKSKVAATALPTLPDPTVTGPAISYQNFSANPLFASTGPSADDIHQGDVGDCYYLSTLAAVAKVDPMRIESQVVQLSDGTFLVQINKNGVNDFVHVDGNLPVWNNSNGQLAYEGLGAQGSTWAAIMEKAFAVVRTGADSYGSLNSGWMSESFSTLGLQSTNFLSYNSANALMSILNTQLAEGKAVTIGTDSTVTGPLIGSHAYTVIAMTTDASGNITGVEVRNPWGIDGVANSSNPNDGYVTVTAAQAFASFAGVCTAFA